MKLFLSSLTISKTHAPLFIRLVGKKPTDIKLALIENAVDGEEGSKDWVVQHRKAIQSQGFNVEIVDLKQFKGKKRALKATLSSKDAIWLGGGNTYYLRWLLRNTGADKIIKGLVARGTVYGGGSAGAIVAGPTLKHFEAADDPNKAPELILDGLNLTNSVVVPHMDNEKFKAVIHDLNDKLKADGYKTAPLTDAEVLVVEGEKEVIA